ncbi:hypothetical protein QBC39DRAFT_385415 [Podospora conica]|nr:hypothetical protein QBC39DRAFT_385415 [Schizothecium conicum]
MCPNNTREVICATPMQHYRDNPKAGLRLCLRTKASILWVMYESRALPHTINEDWYTTTFLPKVHQQCGLIHFTDFRILLPRFNRIVKHYVCKWGFANGLLVKPGGSSGADQAAWKPDVVTRWFTGPDGVERWLRSMGKVDPWMEEEQAPAQPSPDPHSTTAGPMAVDALSRGLDAMNLDTDLMGETCSDPHPAPVTAEALSREIDEIELEMGLMGGDDDMANSSVSSYRCRLAIPPRKPGQTMSLGAAESQDAGQGPRQQLPVINADSEPASAEPTLVLEPPCLAGPTPTGVASSGDGSAMQEATGLPKPPAIPVVNHRDILPTPPATPTHDSTLALIGSIN